MDGLLAGVLARPPNIAPAGLGVSCGPAPDAGVALPKAPGVEGAALLLASFAPAAPLNIAVVGVDAPAGLAPNKFDGAAGFEAAFAPNKPAPLDWLFWPACPNKFEPGGGPAGVVEGSEKVLLGAGVAAGVEEPVVHR